jgi:hypothetical protein
MKSQVMEERIRRVTVLFHEMDFRLVEDERSHESYSATFENDDGFQAGLLIDRGSRFLEIAYTFSFSPVFSNYLRDKLEEMLKICYEFGCYTSLQRTKSEVSFSVFIKEYYSGLTYYSLRDNLRDFKRCVETLSDLLEIDRKEKEGKEEKAH